MGYYGMQGDYYRGDYYQGDPGFFGFIGKALKGIAGTILCGGAGTKTIIQSPAVTGIVKRLPAGIRKVGPMILPAIRKIGKGGAIAGAVGVAAGALGERAYMGGGGGGRRYRRMNVTNVRALRRSIRRCAGFAKLAKRVIRFTSPRPPRGRAYFKPRARKKV